MNPEWLADEADPVQAVSLDDCVLSSVDVLKMRELCRHLVVMLKSMRDGGIDVGRSVEEIEDAIGV